MKIVVTVDRKDSIDVDVNKMHQVTIKLGEFEIYFENKKDAVNFIEELETALCDGDTKSDLEDKVSDL
ncbi:hypothetical protein, partial [Propionibacterium freudenreichii]|uniref:hypothetical protein n=1 Tax=Propionibacterium freudenreichii TaxID=1744 RepID=UPI003854BEB2